MGNNLSLNLKRQFFDLHLNGKKDEYRVISPYWCSRFLLYRGEEKTAKQWRKLLMFVEYEKNRYRVTNASNALLQRRIMLNSTTFKSFDLCIFPNGMTPPIPKFEKDFKKLRIGIGKKEWGAPDYPVFIIECGEAKNIVNVK